MPYLDFQLKGAILVNKQVRLVDDYEISLAPSLGLNLTFVGEILVLAAMRYPRVDLNYAKFGKFVVTNINEIVMPSKLFGFCLCSYHRRNLWQSGRDTMP